MDPYFPDFTKPPPPLPAMFMSMSQQTTRQILYPVFNQGESPNMWHNDRTASPDGGYSNPGNVMNQPSMGFRPPNASIHALPWHNERTASPDGGYSNPGNPMNQPSMGFRPSNASIHALPWHNERTASPDGGYSNPGNPMNQPSMGFRPSNASIHALPWHNERTASPDGGYSNPGNVMNQPSMGFRPPNASIHALPWHNERTASPDGGYSNPGNPMNQPSMGFRPPNASIHALPWHNERTASPDGGYSNPGNIMNQPSMGFRPPNASIHALPWHNERTASPDGGYSNPGNIMNQPSMGFRPPNASANETPIMGSHALPRLHRMTDASGIHHVPWNLRSSIAKNHTRVDTPCPAAKELNVIDKCVRRGRKRTAVSAAQSCASGDSCEEVSGEDDALEVLTERNCKAERIKPGSSTAKAAKTDAKKEKKTSVIAPKSCIPEDSCEEVSGEDDALEVLTERNCKADRRKPGSSTAKAAKTDAKKEKKTSVIAPKSCIPEDSCEEVSGEDDALEVLTERNCKADRMKPGSSTAKAAKTDAKKERKTSVIAPKSCIPEDSCEEVSGEDDALDVVTERSCMADRMKPGSSTAKAVKTNAKKEKKNSVIAPKSCISEDSCEEVSGEDDALDVVTERSCMADRMKPGSSTAKAVKTNAKKERKTSEEDKKTTERIMKLFGEEGPSSKPSRRSLSSKGRKQKPRGKVIDSDDDNVDDPPEKEKGIKFSWEAGPEADKPTEDTIVILSDSDSGSDDNMSSPKGVNKEDLLKDRNQELSQECALCMIDFLDDLCYIGESQPCGHQGCHYHCMLQYYYEYGRCPICQKETTDVISVTH